MGDIPISNQQFFLLKPQAQVGDRDIPISNQHAFLIKPQAQVGDIPIYNQHFYSN